MGKNLIVAEKPSVAASIASALGATKKNGYFESNEYYVSYCFGHLYTLYDTVEYNPEMEKWDLKDYPFIPERFKYKAKDDEGVKKQIKILKDLVSKSSSCICATDGDREGEVIFCELRDDLKITKPIKRLWITSHTQKDVEHGMNNLVDSMINLEKAGYCRQQIDWILGINLTVVFSLKAGGQVTFKLGRVILPTLKLIFDREAAIASFKSTPFYMLKSEFKSVDESYIGTYYTSEGNRFLNKDQLISVQKSIKDQPGTIVKKEGNTANENAPKLFNLTALQGHITSKFKGFTSDKVLKVMQSLYEKKYLTYPRTASRYLDETLVKSAEESLKAVMNITELNIKDNSDIKFHTDKKVFDSSKVDSHPALMPTYVIPDFSSLSDDEKIVYLEVAKRFISQFMPAAVYETVEIVTKVNEHEFITKGKVLVKEGWKQLYINQDQGSNEDDPEENNNEESITAKHIKIGDTVKVDDTEIKEGKTNPPAHYTEKTLLTAMENCGKEVENEEEVLKGYTIGTPATRAETIKKLFDCGYVYQKGKSILITELGAKVIHFFPVKRLLRTDFTGQIEKTLKLIENGEYDSNVFMDKMKDYIVKNIVEMKNSKIPEIKKPVKVIGKCLKCGKNVIETDKAYCCEATRNNECNFTLWKDDKFFKTFGKKLTETIATELVNKKQALVKKLKSPSKENTTFDAVVRLEENTETGYWNYKLDFDSKPQGKKGPGKTKKTTIKFKRNV